MYSKPKSDLMLNAPERLYRPDELEALDRQNVPRHVAIIPDGNRRWAKKHLINPTEGHRKGLEVFEDTFRAAAELGVQILTFYTFSTENWSRPAEEVKFLMRFLESSLIDHREQLLQNGVRLGVIGDRSRLTPRINQLLEETIDLTKEGDGIQLLLAINYGARDELRRAMLHIMHDVRDGKLNESELDEVTLARYLDTAPWGDPELLIRTSGEYRLSNYLLWQLSYSELYFTDVLWPDFTPKHFLAAILEYQQRAKRLGS